MSGPATVVCCLLAYMVQAEPPAPGNASEHSPYETSRPFKNTGKLRFVSASLPEEDKKLAGRPSPYFHASAPGKHPRRPAPHWAEKREEDSEAFVPSPTLVVSYSDVTTNDAPLRHRPLDPAAFNAPLPWKVAARPAPLATATAVADSLPVDVAGRIGGDNRAVLVARSELASMMLVSASSTANISGAASAQAGIQLAANDANANDAKNMGGLAPAAGGSDAGLMPAGTSLPTPTLTLPDAPSAVVTAPLPPLPNAPVTVITTPLAPLPVALPPVTATPVTVITTMPASPVPGGPVGAAPVPTVTVVRPAEMLELPPTAHSAAMTEPVMPSLSSDAPFGLTPQSRAIVDRLPPERRKVQKRRAPVSVSHVEKNPLEDNEVRKHEGVGISISVRRPKPNTSHMLEEAYDALIAGNQEDAIALYRQVLDDEPDNRLALFGLATTYHRAGQLKLARPLYGRLLALYPNDAEGLNNFLVLLADESPMEALDEMRKLELTHPDFSPLPAQMAVVYEKMGEHDEAIVNMKHAIELSPENIKYRYDMAVMLDKDGDWENAALFYQQLITADERGEKIPANAEKIQERLTFIRSNKPETRVVEVVHPRPQSARRDDEMYPVLNSPNAVK